VHRTRYRPDRWRWPELVVATGGVMVAAIGWWISQTQLLLAYPALDVVPQVSAAGLTAAGSALATALCAPQQARP
jgi:energy-coupling factor transport system permease protein